MSTIAPPATAPTVPAPRRPNLRAALAADPSVGTANVLHKLIEHGAPLDRPTMAFDTAVDGHAPFHTFTLGELREAAARRAAWLYARGVRRRDPVAVYVSSSADCFLHFMAAAWIGAVPALMNPNIPGDIAAEFIRRLKATAMVTDAEHLDRLAASERGDDLGFAASMVFDAAGTGEADPAQAPALYKHHGEDPVVITHSSGTTRMPTATLHSHDSLFAATRLIRLGKPRARGTERILSALPAPHAAGIMTMNHALCNGSELLYLSRQDDGMQILETIERWRPSAVFGFAVTWSELARVDLTQRAVDSVALWFNTGDCAHETHIRHLVNAGSHDEVTREGVRRVPGSAFVDGLGSTEMGHSAWHITHTPTTNRYGRCVGRRHDFAEIVLFDPTTGEEVPDGGVGMAGMKSPTLAPSYWNNSVETYRNRWKGYYLTGDMMFKDDEGYYYHVDRFVDSVDLGDGNWLYTAMSEEKILRACPDIRDCTVVSAPTPDGVVSDVLLNLHDGADPDADRREAVLSALTPAAAATVRDVVVIGDDRLILGPTGKVRKFLMRQRHLAYLAGVWLPGLEGEPDQAPAPTRRLPVSFAGEGSGRGPLAWGQKDIWKAMVRQKSWLPLGGWRALEPGTTVEDVAGELAYLHGRFPSFRTRLTWDGGPVGQELSASGQTALDVFDTAGGQDPESLAEAVHHSYRHRAFDMREEWPIRMAVVRDGGVPTHLVVTMMHWALDVNGAAVMLRDVAARESGPLAGQQPLEQARWQGSEAGQRHNAKTLAHIEEVLRSVPARRFPAALAKPERQRYWQGRLVSPALSAAVPAISLRTGVDPSSVLGTLYAISLARLTGNEHAVLRPVVSNRFRPGVSGAVCHGAQSGVLSVHLAGTTYDEAVEVMRKAAMGALKHAYYDMDDYDALVARISAELGEDLDVGVFYNDRRLDTAPDPDAAAPSLEELEAARARAEHEWTLGKHDPLERVALHVEDSEQGLVLSFDLDTHVVSKENMLELVRGIEAAAVEAALDGAAPTGIGAP